MDLADHEEPAQDGLFATPLSTVVPEQMIDWMNESKLNLKPIEDDVKDAKRRVTPRDPQRDRRFLWRCLRQ